MQRSVIISDLDSVIKQPTILLEKKVFICSKDYEMLKRYSNMQQAKFLLENLLPENVVEVENGMRLIGLSEEECYFISCIKELKKLYGEDVKVLTCSSEVKSYCKRNSIELY